MRLSDFKKRAVNALKGRIFTILLVFFLPQILVIVSLVSLLASSWLVDANNKNMSLEEKAKETFITNHLQGTKNEKGLITGNENASDIRALEQRAEKMMYADKRESNIVKLAKLGDKIRVEHSIGCLVILILSILVLIYFSFLVIPGVLKCLLDVGRMEDISLSILFSNIKLVPKMFIIMLIYFLATLVGTVLLFIPGIIMEARLYFAPFVLIDNPSKSIFQCLKDSWQVSKNSGVINLCLFRMSFIGWAIAFAALCVLLGNKLPLVIVFAQCLYYIYVYESSVQYYLYYSNQEHTINFANSYAN